MGHISGLLHPLFPIAAEADENCIPLFFLELKIYLFHTETKKYLIKYPLIWSRAYVWLYWETTERAKAL